MSKKSKIIIGIISFILFIGIGIFGWLLYDGKIVLRASTEYSAKFIKQDPKGEISLKQGEIKKIIVKFQNNGTKTWQKNNIYLRLKDNKNISKFFIPDNDFYQKIIESKNATSGWLDPVKINFIENTVEKGETANFIFFVQGPFETGKYKEIYQLVENSNNKETKISNSEITMSFSVSKKISIPEINKNSDTYKILKEDLQKQGIDVDKQQDIINIQNQINKSKNSSEKSNSYKQLAELTKDQDINSAIESLKKAKEEAEKIENDNEREKILKEIDEEIKSLEEQKKSDEEISKASKEEAKVAESKEAKTIRNNPSSSSVNKPVKVAGVTTGGLIGGAVAGGAVGSVVPGIGTAVGALGGALLGGLGGLIGGLLGF